LLVGRQFRGFVLETLRGLKLEHASEPIQVVYKLTFAISAISLAAFGYGVVGVLVGDVIASAVIILIELVVIVRHIPLSSVVESVPASLPRREMLGFNYYVMIHALLIVSLYQVDVLMLGATVGSEQTGYYKAALVLVEFLCLAPRSIESVMLQSTAGLWERGNIERIEMLASRATRYALVLTLLLAIGIGVLAADHCNRELSPEWECHLRLLVCLPTCFMFCLPSRLQATVARSIR
jgi:O-antigen/teichoic acid export membrane protein